MSSSKKGTIYLTIKGIKQQDIEKINKRYLEAGYQTRTMFLENVLENLLSGNIKSPDFRDFKGYMLSKKSIAITNYPKEKAHKLKEMSKKQGYRSISLFIIEILREQGII